MKLPITSLLMTSLFQFDGIDLYVLLSSRTAPEVLNGKKFTLASDVWAFGVTAWEVLTTYFNCLSSDIGTRQSALQLAQ